MKDETFEMLTWAFNLGQHSSELRKLKQLLGEYIDEGTTSEQREVYEVQRLDVEHIFNRLDFISTNMVP